MPLMPRRPFSPALWACLCLTLPMALQAHTHDRHHKRHHGQGMMQGSMTGERGTAPADAPRFSTAQAEAARSYFDEEGHQGYVVPARPRRSGQTPAMPMQHWQLGQPLPTQAMTFPLPRPLILAMGTAPDGYRYLRMDDDILLVADASNMVVDVIEGVAR